MSTVYSTRPSGLIIAEHAADFDSVNRALKDFDPALVLNSEVDADGRPFYTVHKIVSRDRPALPICSWFDDSGNPLPLSHRLVDKVKELHPDSRRLRGGLDTDQYAEKQNQALKDRRRADGDAESLEIARDMVPRIRGRSRPAFHRGIHLRRTRMGGVGG